MTRSLILSLLALLCLNVKAEKKSQKAVCVKDAFIIDMLSNQDPRKGSVLIEGGKISTIHYGDNVPEVENVKVVDATGKYLIPGLIDAHVHLTTMSFDDRAKREKFTSQLLKQMLFGGITSVRDMAGDTRLLAELKRASALHEIPAPNIYYSAFIAGPAYYEGNDREGRSVAGWPEKYAPWLQCITPETNLTYAIAQAKGTGASGIKIYASIDAELLAKIIAEAKKQGIGVWGHSCIMSAKPSDGVKAGMEVISHAEMLKWEQCPSLSTKMFDNYEKYYGKFKFDFPELDHLFLKMKEKNIILDATCYHGTVNGLKEAAIFTKKAHEMGVKVAAGTDYFTDPDKKELPFIHEEMETLVNKCDFSPYEALRSATFIAAETFKMEKEIGSIEEGKIADLLLLNSNPLKNISNTRDINLVIKNGVVYKK